MRTIVLVFGFAALLIAAGALADGTPADRPPEPLQQAIFDHLVENPPHPDIPAACFAPNTAQAYVEEVNDRISAFAGLSLGPSNDDSLSKYRLGGRWSNTATDGPGLTQGDPTTLTWSYVGDGTPIPGFAGEPASPSNLITWLNGTYGGFANWHTLFIQIFDRWSELTGFRYVYEPNDDAAAFGATPGLVGVRGDLRIGAHLIDGNNGILAYNFFPNNGDMVIDSADSFYNNMANNSRGLRNVLAHEHGHGLGLRHVCPVNGSKLMEPFVNLSFDGPQFDDILGAQRGYGDANEHNDTFGTATTISSDATMSHISIDDGSGEDWFSFTADAGEVVSLSVAPSGAPYLEGPQNANGSCSAGTLFDPTTELDLEVELIDTDGVTLIAAANANPIGGSETLTNVALPGAGTYFVRVLNNETTERAQMYTFEPPSAACACPDEVRRVGGIRDDCLLPTEPVTRSQRLDDAFPGASWKAFDDMSSNRFFGHTLAPLPANICGAVLQIAMKPHADVPTNDGIRLGILPNGVAFTIRNLPEAGGTWNPADNEKTLFTLDLANLPGGGDIVSQVAADRYLDVFVSDDTAVDWMQLDVKRCRPIRSRFHRACRPDGLALPFDQTYRRLDRDQFPPTAVWKDCDDPSFNRNVGHTFRNLPGGLLDAHLWVRMQPQGGLSSNDSLSVGLVDLPPLTEPFASPIENLSEANGTWQTNPLTFFHLDLDDLPDGSSLLSQVQTDRYLDFRVQDDTNVDTALLLTRSCDITRFGGLPTTELGDATAFLGPSEQLVVSDLGDTGDDGIEVALGDAQGYCLAVEQMCLGAKGDGLTLSMNGTVDNQVDGSITGDVAFSGTNPVTLTATFSSPYDRYLEVRIKNAGVTTGSHTGMVNGAVAEIPPDTCFEEFDFFSPCFSYLLTQPTPVQILQGGPLAVGDRIEICHGIIVGMGPTVNTFALRAAGFGEVTATTGQLMMFDHLFEAVGDVSFETAHGELTVADISPAGGGAAIVLDQASQIDIDLPRLFEPPLQPLVAAGRVHPVGRRPGSLSMELLGLGLGCSLRVTETDPGGVSLTGSFLPINAPTQEVQVLADGEVVGLFSGQAPVTTVAASTRPIGVGAEGPAMRSRHPADTTFTVDGTVVVGDTLVLRPEGGDAFSFLTRVELRAEGLQQFTVAAPATAANAPVFSDGFESGDTSAWDNTTP